MLYNDEAEAVLITALASNGRDYVPELRARGIGPAHFSSSRHRDIVEAAFSLADRDPDGAIIIQPAIVDELRRQNKPEAADYLSLLDLDALDYLDSALFEWAVAEVRRLHLQRRLQRQSGKQVAALRRAGGNLEPVAIKLAGRFRELARDSGDLTADDEFLLTQSADDEGNAQSVYHLHKGQFLYCPAFGWMAYTGTHWAPDEAESKLERAIVATLKRRRMLAVQAENEKLVKATSPSAAHVKGTKFNLKSIIETADPAPITTFDNDPDLLNCKNGVVNLRTRQLTPHDPEQRFTSCVPVAYDPKADDSVWVNLLYEALKPEGTDDTQGEYAELLVWIQMAVGYSLTGHTHEQCLFYIWGPPRSGKGLFLQTLADLIGRPLAAGVDFDTFTAKRVGDSQKFDLAPLRPARLLTASESGRANMLNAKVVKAITGNDPIYCAFKHRDHFQYTPRFKIWLASNFKVMADPNDDAFWGRLRVIHFPNSWLGREDLLLAEKLKANLPGILKWAIDGAMEWYKRLDAGQGLGRPAIIEAATADHRTQNDTIQQFIDERCTVGDGLYCKSSAFNQAYRRWCDDNGHKPLGAIRIREALERMKFHRKQVKQDGTNLGQCWLGVGLGQQKGNR